MVQVSKRAGLTDSALVRLLSRLTRAELPEPRQAFAERLAAWIGWTDAIALGNVLSAEVPIKTLLKKSGSLRAEEAECRHVRSELIRAIAEDSAPPAGPRQAEAFVPSRSLRPAALPPVDPAPVDGAGWRRRYLARQQAMETAVGSLRTRLRSRLAALPAPMSKLAAVDAVVEKALAERERVLLSQLPAWLEPHFNRLRQASQEQAVEQTDPAEPSEARESVDGPWLDDFRQDLQALLLAELEFRWQPIEGLLEALRKNQAQPHA